VPGEYGVRLDEDERRPPTAPRLRQPRPENPIAAVRRSRGGRERFRAANSCRSARTSRCRAARDRAADRSAKTSETTTEATSRAYSTPSATSITPLTTFLVGTAFDADAAKDSAREIREYYIPDFSNWKDEHAFEAALTKLLNALMLDEKPMSKRD
jgi:hypothetical protein